MIRSINACGGWPADARSRSLSRSSPFLFRGGLRLGHAVGEEHQRVARRQPHRQLPGEEAQALRLEQRRGGRRRALDHVGHRHRRHVPLELAGLDLGEVEHVVDQLGEAFALADDHLQVVAHLPHGLRHLAVADGHEREDAFIEPLLDEIWRRSVW
jgi:hypothetical protein